MRMHIILPLDSASQHLTVGVFDEAEKNIWTLMNTDSFRRFRESSQFNALSTIFVLSFVQLFQTVQ